MPSIILISLQNGETDPFAPTKKTARKKKLTIQAYMC